MPDATKPEDPATIEEPTTPAPAQAPAEGPKDIPPPDEEAPGAS
ncbi:hypothetical protein [Pseudomonas sp.]|nr:hypothetical protein [Pseudomonas sp.]